MAFDDEVLVDWVWEMCELEGTDGFLEASVATQRVVLWQMPTSTSEPSSASSHSMDSVEACFHFEGLAVAKCEHWESDCHQTQQIKLS